MSVLNLEESKRAILEIVESAGESGIEEEAMSRAYEELENLKIDAALWAAWETVKLSIGWDGEELTFTPIEQ